MCEARIVKANVTFRSKNIIIWRIVWCIILTTYYNTRIWGKCYNYTITFRRTIKVSSIRISNWCKCKCGKWFWREFSHWACLITSSKYSLWRRSLGLSNAIRSFCSWTSCSFHWCIPSKTSSIRIKFVFRYRHLSRYQPCTFFWVWLRIWLRNVRK